ncbi:FecR family protein [Paremcibacter congregatus]|uniref:FecR family protein n=1 Tax=Paremcibacter congregatus TaxID=2043170 RepID=UPI0030EBA4FE|tara:strand:+ start:3125 stop:4126 length:1002 start_codon:yes stop_codon:yes gene_type:complete
MTEMDKNQTVVEMDKLSDQAATWFQRMSDKDVPEATREEFDNWIDADAAHRNAYQQYSAIWHHPELDGILQDFADEERKSNCYAAKPFLTMPKMAAIAASITLFVSVWFYSLPTEQIDIQFAAYRTQVGEMKTVTLPDGSTVALNTDTKIRISFGEDRRVYLQQGEAYFDVKKDGRAFIIEGGTGRIKVLGTAFNTRVSYNQMIVVVDHGRVAVSPQNSTYQEKILYQNDKLAVTDQRLGSVRKVKVESEIADWRDGWLEINDASLAEVVRELDRYYAGEIRLTERNLWQLRVTGRFNLKDIDRAIRMLGKSMQLTVSKSENDEIILSRKTTG